MKRYIELSSVLDETGTKRISIIYDDIDNKLYIKEGDDMKLIENKTEEKTYTKTYSDIKLSNPVMGKPKRTGTLPRNMTKYEQIVHYYYSCMTTNYGDLKPYGTMFKEWKQIPFEEIEKRWFAILRKYNIID